MTEVNFGGLEAAVKSRDTQMFLDSVGDFPRTEDPYVHILWQRRMTDWLKDPVTGGLEEMSDAEITLMEEAVKQIAEKETVYVPTENKLDVARTQRLCEKAVALYYAPEQLYALLDHRDVHIHNNESIYNQEPRRWYRVVWHALAKKAIAQPDFAEKLREQYGAKLMEMLKEHRKRFCSLFYENLFRGNLKDDKKDEFIDLVKLAILLGDEKENITSNYKANVNIVWEEYLKGKGRADAREFMAYVVSADALAKERFMGIEWPTFNPAQMWWKEVRSLVQSRDWYELKSETKNLAARLYRDGTSILPGRDLSIFWEEELSRTIEAFTIYSQERRPAGWEGDHILRLININQNSKHPELYLRQPFTLEAIKRLHEDGRKFATALLKRAAFDAISVWERPDLESVLPMEDPGEHLIEASVCNTKAEEMKRLKQKALQYRTTMSKQPHDIVWVVEDNHIFMIKTATSEARIYRYNGDALNYASYGKGLSYGGDLGRWFCPETRHDLDEDRTKLGIQLATDNAREKFAEARDARCNAIFIREDSTFSVYCANTPLTARLI